jgi:hypothetical protein
LSHRATVSNADDADESCTRSPGNDSILRVRGIRILDPRSGAKRARERRCRAEIRRSWPPFPEQRAPEPQGRLRKIWVNFGPACVCASATFAMGGAATASLDNQVTTDDFHDSLPSVGFSEALGHQATSLAAWPSWARRSCTAMIACRISQIGTSTVGTKDQGACCIASEPGPGKNCKGERQHEIASIW